MNSIRTSTQKARAFARFVWREGREHITALVAYMQLTGYFAAQPLLDAHPIAGTAAVFLWQFPAGSAVVLLVLDGAKISHIKRLMREEIHAVVERVKERDKLYAQSIVDLEKELAK